MTAGQSYTVTVSFGNDGQLAWNNSFYFDCMGQSFLMNNTTKYPVSGNVAANGTANFTVTLTPPAVGDYYLAYGIRWTGVYTLSQIVIKEVTVT